MAKVSMNDSSSDHQPPAGGDLFFTPRWACEKTSNEGATPYAELLDYDQSYTPHKKITQVTIPPTLQQLTEGG